MHELMKKAIIASIEAGKEILKVYGYSDFEIKIKSDNSPLTIADKRAHNVITDYLNNTGLPILSEEGRNIPFDERKNWTRFWLVDPLDGTKEFIKRNEEFTVNIALIENGEPIAGVVYIPVNGTLFLGTIEDGAFRFSDANKLLNNISNPNWFEFADKLPEVLNNGPFRVVASRSHMNPETEEYIDKLKQNHPVIEIVSIGSSLKLCLIAEGEADIYPRFGPTNEWDTAAGHAIIKASGGKVVLADNMELPLVYNKKDLLNPFFIATR